MVGIRGTKKQTGGVHQKKDADKDRTELIAELNDLRSLISRLKVVVKHYERVPGKKDLYHSLYDLETRKDSVESLRDELRQKQMEIDFQGEELGVQNEELRAQQEEIFARDEKSGWDGQGVSSTGNCNSKSNNHFIEEQEALKSENAVLKESNDNSMRAEKERERMLGQIDEQRRKM
jgi:hypothetical protein